MTPTEGVDDITCKKCEEEKTMAAHYCNRWFIIDFGNESLKRLVSLLKKEKVKG